MPAEEARLGARLGDAEDDALCLRSNTPVGGIVGGIIGEGLASVVEVVLAVRGEKETDVGKSHVPVMATSGAFSIVSSPTTMATGAAAGMASEDTA